MALRSDLVSGIVTRPIVEHTHFGETAPVVGGVEVATLLLESDAKDVGVDARELSSSLRP